MTGRLHAKLWMAGLMAVSLGACSLLIDPDAGPRRCGPSATGENPCPPGQVCQVGVCQPAVVVSQDAGCQPSDELCDGRDNDCDGQIDEGHDIDGDGFSWCGGGLLDRSDCDDSDPGVHPADGDTSAAVERCDGKDNDCNGAIDDPPGGTSGLCPAPQMCLDRACVIPDCTYRGHECPGTQRCDLAVSPPVCVATAGCTPGSCTPPAVCDVESGSCIARRALGESCDSHVQCASGNCVSGAAAGLSAGRLCAQACCSDADCPTATVCWSKGTGAKLCLPEALVGRRRGPGAGLAPCSTGSQCASGICIGGLGCVGTCARDQQCEDDAVCGLLGPYSRSDVTNYVQLACVTAPGDGDAWDECSADGCKSGLCLNLGSSHACSAACATTADCPPGPTFASFCGYAWRESDTGRLDVFQVCLPSYHGGTGRTGDTCDDDRVCRDFACVSERCADTCCSDRDCAAGTLCRPVPAGTRWEMHCLSE